MTNPIYKSLLSLIYDSVVSEGGDGDAFWFCKHLNLDEVEELIKGLEDPKFKHWDYTREKDRISWGVDQEWVTITDSKRLNAECPSYTTLKIYY